MADSSNQDPIDTAERHNTPMDSDNNSETTEVMGANATFEAPKMIEKCIKFVFRVTTSEEASTVAQGHFHILKAINDAFGSEVIITDNANERVTKFKLTGFFPNTSGNLKSIIDKETTSNKESTSPRTW
jgi:hypothetical protein